ncbi:MAG: hypothetical protein GAK43_02587 [Stenotrophomonas maltophilia]|nr:MAG: hypothetical protein GAK43_02587 [Stenotrophomonas maltophilia]
MILLSEAEFNGELCPPPALPAGNPLLVRTPEPQWLSRGAAASFVPEWADESYYVVKALGGLPEVGHQQRYALTWEPREQDPNAGIIPSEDGSTGYQPFYYWENGKVDIEHYRQYDWAEFLKPNHIGGTLRPIQGIPDIGPFYIGFEEYLGGFNFGGGNAQLDFENMKFDWACG